MEFAKIRFPSGKKVSYTQKGKVISKKPSKRRSKGIVSVINRAPMRDHTAVPDKLLTTCSISYTGLIAAAGTGGNYFAVYGNSFYQPFNSSQTATAGAVTPIQGSSVTVTPLSYTAYAGLYQQYRVRASRIKVTFTPSALTDAFTMSVYPSPSVTNTTTQPYKAASERYSKWKMCTCNNNVKENTVINYMSSARALGLTNLQYETLPATAFGSAPVVNTDWYWQVSYFANSNVANVSPIYVQVELDMYLELTDPFPLVN